MTIRTRIAYLPTLITSVILFPTSLLAEDFCKDVLEHAARNYMSDFSLEEKNAWVYYKYCGTEEQQADASVNIIVDAMPLGGSFSRANKAQWCKENRRLESYYKSFQRIENTVSVPAIRNWSSCMEANSKNLTTRVVLSPNEALIQILATNRTPHPEKITKILIQSDEGQGIVCESTISTDNPSIDLPPGRTVNIDCVRSLVQVNRQGQPYEVLPGGSIALTNTLSPYLFGFQERFKEEAIPEITIPERLVMPLRGVHVGTRGYWAGGANSTLLKCSDHIMPPNDDFELIEIGTREERVTGRGRCGTPPYCDSHNEFCTEVYYTNACFINKAWHEWYKNTSMEQGVPYSKEAVCGKT